MSTLHPFPALRPPRDMAARVSSLPYDVMNHQEAKEMAAGNDASFLHICRSDIDTGEEAIHAQETYARAKENLEAFIRKGYLVQDGAPSFYIYRQIMWGRVQTGIVGCASVDEYANGTIKKHELTRREKELDRIDWMKDVTPHDLVKYGLIPELVGRIPVITALNALDEESLVRILREPKNSLVNQYKKLFDLDKVDLEFSEDALVAIAKKTLERKTGARGLRSIMEDLLMPLMYQVPSDYTVEKVVVTRETVAVSYTHLTLPTNSLV